MELTIRPLTKKLLSLNINQIFFGILVSAIILGGGVGYLLANTKSSNIQLSESLTNKTPKTADQDTKTFRDFAEGTIQKVPESKNPNDYQEGTHMLIREGGYPVTLTSSVVDLSEYEGKAVKVLGETQKALKSGWLMDVGKVEVKN